MKVEVDTLVIGAGVIGSSVAMHLAELGGSGIRVVDFDLEGSLSSSELNAGGVRATWYHPINIGMSKSTIEFFAEHADEVGYRACGYLWLHSPEKIDAALAGREKMLKVGWPVESWDVAGLKNKVPFIDKTDGIAGAIFSPRDGLVNPNLVKNFYRSRAKKKGVIFDDRTLIRRAEFEASSKRNWRISAERFEGPISTENKIKIYGSHPGDSSVFNIEYHAKQVINCAGPWAGRIAAILGYESPCLPVRRQVSIFDCRDVDLTPYGMIVDTSGVYFHPEATNGLAGFATPGEPGGINFKYDGEDFFMEKIWAPLFERSTGFERLKHVTGWAGLYEVSPDESAILGEVDLSPAIRGKLFEAHSFSGHGVMHSYAAGKALAEKMIHGKYESLDLAPLSARRFSGGHEVRESLVI